MKIPMINFRRVGKLIKHGLVKHSADILTGFTAAGVVLTAIETHKATLKAEEYLRVNGYSEANPDTQKILKIEAAKKYVLPVAIGAGTIGAAVGANYINHKQIAGLAAACTLAETALSEHRDKIEELMGTKALTKIDDDILADKGRRIVANQQPILETGHGNILCIEGLTGQKFHASPEWVYRCRNEFNERVNLDQYCSYGEFLEILWCGCKDVFIPKHLYDVGYNIHANGLLTIKSPHYEGDEDSEPYLVFEPYNNPISTYMEIL